MLINLGTVGYCTREIVWFYLHASEIYDRKINLKSLKITYLTLPALSPKY